MIIEIEREADGRWIADIAALPGALVYGDTRKDAVRKVKALAARILAERAMESDGKGNFPLRLILRS